MPEGMSLGVARDGGVVTLTIDFPARRNALAVPLRARMAEVLEEAQGDPSVRAFVVTGAAGNFCSGADISGMDVRDAMSGAERMRRSHRLIRLIAAGNKPVVAAVEGWCVGAGLSLACACDLIVAAEDARFMAGFGKIGLMADLGLPYTLPARIGAGRARRMLMLHQQLSAGEAERIGLVEEVVHRGQALHFALERARFLAAQAPAPMALTKAMFAAGLDAALETERHFQSTLFLSADHKEGRAAFLEKREAQFTGS
ncbi:enoyl-CoA hydratase/isomerase family protein [Roseomonas sp. SSH11]|uniref:Enoyl-CoA hydratase/isomerase family protein n=2 Tax=Pararoseomonas baculiformis TaxID=2820812 RepID=A0ABS4AJJ4_9PROT|nr:enoyl-CoA hydratase/isomerase family protein [Pararoseomonas baculiformis]